jgi:hypothetical protein
MKTAKLSRIQVIANLYIFITALAILSLVLGMNLSSLAHSIGHGDQYQTLRLDEISTCTLAVSVLLMCFAIHRSIRLLSKPDNEQTLNSTSV